MRAILVIFLLIISTYVFGQAAPVSPCAGAEFKQLDFWLGDWDARWDASPSGPAGHGSNHITRTYGGCVTEEHFEGGPLAGHSVSTYFGGSKTWRQTWVDNQGSYIDLEGGPDGKGNFVLTTLARPGNAKANRMVFADIAPNSFVWHWQATQDGKNWSDSWVIRYTRKKN